jgi:hypothetical protein
MWRFRYVSGFERWLNRGLWAVLVIALVYCAFQHVVLAEIPQRIPFGARLGDLLYDLAIAYVGAFMFYVLVVRLPLLRDRANVYQIVEALLWRVFDESRGLIMELNRMARIDDTRQETPEDLAIALGERPATREHVRSLCERIKPDQDVNIRMLTPSGVRSVTPLEWIRSHAERAHNANQEVQIFAPYLASKVVRLLALIDLSRIDEACTMLLGQESLSRPETLSPLAHPIAMYLYAARQLEDYRLYNFGGRTRDELSADLEAEFGQL